MSLLLIKKLEEKNEIVDVTCVLIQHRVMY